MLIFMGTASFAQEMPRKTILPEKKVKIRAIPRDGFSARKDVDSNVVVPYADVREEDVYYSKRIWREVDLADTVLVKCYLINGSKYSISEQGLVNADVQSTGNGLNAQDCLAIQKYALKMIDKLPV